MTQESGGPPGVDLCMTAPAKTTLSSLGVPAAASEHARLAALGVDLDPAPVSMPGTPLMSTLRDPDGNVVPVVEAA